MFLNYFLQASLLVFVLTFVVGVRWGEVLCLTTMTTTTTTTTTLGVKGGGQMESLSRFEIFSKIVDRPTDRQTDRQTDLYYPQFADKNNPPLDICI